MVSTKIAVGATHGSTQTLQSETGNGSTKIAMGETHGTTQNITIKTMKWFNKNSYGCNPWINAKHYNQNHEMVQQQ